MTLVNVKVERVEIVDAEVTITLNWADAQFYAYVYKNYPQYFVTRDNSVDLAFSKLFGRITDAVDKTRKDHKVSN